MKIGESNMSWTNEEVIKELSIWAEANEDKHVFPDISESEVSYYIDRDEEDNYLMEFSYKNILELRELFYKFGGLSVDPQIIEKLLIGIFQNRCEEVKFNESDMPVKKLAKETGSLLPDFIYVF